MRQMRARTIFQDAEIKGIDYLRGEAAMCDYILALPEQEIESLTLLEEQFRDLRREEREMEDEEDSSGSVDDE